MKTLVPLLLALLAAPAIAQEIPVAPFQAEYAVSRNGSAIGAARIRLARGADGSWEFTTVTEGTKGLAGMIGAELAEFTRFRWRDGLPELIESRYDQKVAFNDRHRRITVDADNGRVHSVDEKHTGDLTFAPNLLDRHVTVLALAADAQRGVKDFAYTVADKQKVEQNVFKSAGSESVETPSGRYEAERIERIRTKNTGRVTTSWLAPALGWVPVKVLQREPDGETMEMRLTKIER
jgi:hypothetical protein